MIDFDSERKIREKKLIDLISQNKDPFCNSFTKLHKVAETNIYIDHTETALEKITINWKIAGRLVQLRDFGKLIFARLMDETGSLQILIDAKRSGTNCLASFQLLNRGDIVGINNARLIKSRTGELTLLVFNFILLAKSLEPLPEKYHGLVDMELRYRQRYLDLIMNSNVRSVFRRRSKIIQLIRNYLNAQEFVEVETPILQDLLTGAAALPFKTFHNALNIPLYLRVAPELYLKRLIVGGMEKVYEIGRLFRNEGISVKHNPEFTAIEIYQAYGDMTTMMNLTEKLLCHLVYQLFDQTILIYQNQKLDFSHSFQKITMKEAVFQHAKIDFNEISSINQAKKLAKEHEIVVEKHQETIGHILNLFFEKYAEKKLIQPTFVYEYPIEISPFAKSYPQKKDYTQRFELFIWGWEIANAFSELNDPREQRKRFQMQAKESDLGNLEANQIDEDYLLALRYGLPPTGGLGIGIDRLVMLLTNQQSIKDVILFPTLKPK